MLAVPPGVTLYLARHGQTKANLEKRFSGAKDTPLTGLGLAQARAVGDILKRVLGPAPAIACVCSPFPRAVATMRIARQAMGLPPDGFVTEPRLQEIDLGLWDQLTDDEARALDPALFEARGNDKWNVHVPGGENYKEAAARATDWVTGLKTDTFAVSHGAIIRILRGLFLGLDWTGMNRLDEMQGVVFRIKDRDVTRLDASGELG